MPNNDIEYTTRINLQNIVGHIVNDFSDGYPSIPSDSQINAAIERVTFSDINNPLNYSCPISQVDFSNTDIVIMLKECHHIFCERSILQWFERNAHCPLCRHDIRTQINNSSSPIRSNSPTSNPLPFIQQLANIISDQLQQIETFREILILNYKCRGIIDKSIGTVFNVNKKLKYFSL